MNKIQSFLMHCYHNLLISILSLQLKRRKENLQVKRESFRKSKLYKTVSIKADLMTDTVK